MHKYMLKSSAITCLCKWHEWEFTVIILNMGKFSMYQVIYREANYIKFKQKNEQIKTRRVYDHIGQLNPNICTRDNKMTNPNSHDYMTDLRKQYWVNRHHLSPSISFVLICMLLHYPPVSLHPIIP